MMSPISHVIFIHGISNKPAPNELKRIWLEALSELREDSSGFDLAAAGVKSTFIYWADLFYDTPLSPGDYESTSDDFSDGLSSNLELDDDPWTQKMLEHFPITDEDTFDAVTVKSGVEGYKRIPLPWVVKKIIIKRLLKEVHDYLFNVGGVRKTIRSRVVSALNNAKSDGRVVLVGHSQGSIIAYDVLTCESLDCPEIDSFMTFGSPLGIDEVQDKLSWNRENGFPGKVKGDWVNIYDSGDLVSKLDARLSDDFKKNGNKVIVDIKENSWGAWRHSATKYLKGAILREHLEKMARGN
ncbi:hypothetical protein [Desulfovibrio gilichinskyi]|uniref:Uncharacterized protein n=1 Tax=Desulfovibrio gilichinskyi TaxID=1519643 RepID=A0A1X7F1A1_9BACT|nr:hypothetical protein [Desulfovibrio gilichinskyi]SMF44015.1 hypothetical protein SAMN06295933_3562 [Desulfovibrio gilichinskyi]